MSVAVSALELECSGACMVAWCLPLRAVWVSLHAAEMNVPTLADIVGFVVCDATGIGVRAATAHDSGQELVAWRQQMDACERSMKKLSGWSALAEQGVRSNDPDLVVLGRKGGELLEYQNDLLARLNQLHMEKVFLMSRIFEQRQQLRNATIKAFTGHKLEGIRRRLGSYHVDRSHTCQQLWDLVDREGIVILQGPPQSGKTATLQLFGAFLENDLGVRVHFVTCVGMHAAGDIDAVLVKRCGVTLAELLIANEPCVILIDEAQHLFDKTKESNCDFWAQIKVLLLQGGSRVRIVLAAGFAGQQSGGEGNSIFTPSYAAASVQITRDMVVGISPAQGNGVSLSLTRQEWRDLADSFASVTGFQLDETAQDQLFTLCAGQVGLLTICLDYLNEELVSRSGEVDEVICDTRLARAFGNHDDMANDPVALSLLDHLLYTGALEAASINDIHTLKVIQRLQTMGIAIVDPDDRTTMMFNSGHGGWGGKNLEQQLKDILKEELKDLKGDVKDLKGDVKDLKKGVKEVDNRLAKLEGKADILAAVLLALLGVALAMIWKAG
ncbi:hypothetical protein JKP88DRAFT_263588 [Tribonema minus]|uniref:AAA+ ATPase domain-containing protein n=1 Tax=Tribonema minus TaxID=303371 RepID=A0A835YTS0_9STRA|nr:hypothetical protein JKP88DRAFT_263588 [Tribonema minus]